MFSRAGTSRYWQSEERPRQRRFQNPVLLSGNVLLKGRVAETFPPASVGSTVDTYLILYGQCGCPESAGNAVSRVDRPEVESHVCIMSPHCALRPKGCLRYPWDVLGMCYGWWRGIAIPEDGHPGSSILNRAPSSEVERRAGQVDVIRC